VAKQEIDLKSAINAVSDVVQNRPRPLRELDQIYMKTGDMLLQAELVANWAKDKRLAFIGDGDAISICVAYLKARQIIDYGPSKIMVFDFDERICGAVNRFADKERLELLEARLYNCLDSFPDEGRFDFFYTNPPWGASNGGESVKVFVERGMEATGFVGEGLVVIADDDELPWCQQVLHATQRFASDSGYFVKKMMSKIHEYHLDDAPHLRSCNLFLRALSDERKIRPPSQSITDPKRLNNFYGRNSSPVVRYVRERKRVDYGKAHDDEYSIEKY
jgi:N4-bis(aminopropyl)spermidine synthase